MTRLGLIGKNISHSLSPALYQEIIGPAVQYDLLDIQTEEQLPSVRDLALTYEGINITTPWKKNYFQYAVESAKRWGAINCLRFKDGQCEATNTDALALEELIPAMQARHGADQWIILGNGVMANVVMGILKDQKKSFRQFARSLGDSLNQLDIAAIENKKSIVINCCSRDFRFEGTIGRSSIFWDLNYAHAFHQKTLSTQCIYVDGYELLKAQAIWAVKFWHSK